MKERVKKTIPWVLILALICSVVTFGLNFRSYPEISEVKADTATTTVSVGNAAPTFTLGPTESPVSATSTPTEATTTQSFYATSSDPNGDNYYLAICKSDAVSPGTGGGAPTCDGGSWCISGSTADDAQASCSTTTQDAWSEVNDWWGFVCDAAASSQQCSGSSQGSGDSGSPFHVNHPPAFTAVTQNPSADPGSNATWYASSSDPDSNPQDQVKLIVCDASGFSTSTDTCTGSQLCASSLVNSDPSCSYSIPTPTDDDGSPYDAYTYVVDTHGFEAYGGSYGDNAQYTVNNKSPSVPDVKLNNEQNIDLTEESTTTVNITGLLSDDNGDADISSAVAKAYRTGIGAGGCSSYNANNCYYNISCNLESTDGDTNRYATCTAVFWYIADPTSGAGITPWSSENWEAFLEATDDDSATGSATSSVAVEVNDLAALDLDTGDIGYGSLGPGQDTGVINVTSTVAATDNCALDTNLSGTAMTDDGNVIDVPYQEYSTTSAPYDNYGDGTDLATSTVEFELELAKSTATTTQSTSNIYWGLAVPGGQATGVYSGQNTFGAVRDELDWP